MDKAEWDGMDSQEKDALVAEKVFGIGREIIKASFNWPPKPFTADRNACALVLDEIERRGNNMIFRFLDEFRKICDISVAGDDLRQAAWFGIRANADLLCCCAVKAVEDATE